MTTEPGLASRHVPTRRRAAASPVSAALEARLRSALLLAGAVSSACEAPQIFNDLADDLVREPEEGYARGGRKLANGEFHDLRFEGVPPSFDVATALDENGDLFVRSLSADESCRVRDVLALQGVVAESLEFEEARLAVLVSEEDGPVLRFSDVSCRLADVGVPGGTLVDTFPLEDGLGVRVEDADGNLLAVNPFRESTAPLGRRLLPALHSLAYQLVVVDGALTLYDRAGAILAQVGTDVVEVAVLPVSGTVLYAERNGDVFAVVFDGRPEARRIATDGCGLLSSGSVGVFASPCAERRLVFYSGKLSAVLSLAGDAAGPRIVDRSLLLERGVEDEARAVTFFRDFDAASDSGTLWAVRAGGEAYPLGERIIDGFLLPLFDASSAERPVVALALRDAEPEEEDGSRVELVAVNGRDEVVLGRGLSAIFDLRGAVLAMADGSDRSGDLIVLESEALPGVVLRDAELIVSDALAGLRIRQRVLLEDARSEVVPAIDTLTERRMLFRTNASAGNRLELLRWVPSEEPPFSDPELLAEDAQAGAMFSRVWSESVLALSGGNAESGHTLRQIWYETGLESAVAENVAEYEESFVSGREGILYATRGPDAGLWFTGPR